MLENFKSYIAKRTAEGKERGASAVEYGLLIAGIAALIVVAVFALGPVIKGAFTGTCDSITGSEGSTLTSDQNCGNDEPATPAPTN